MIEFLYGASTVILVVVVSLVISYGVLIAFNILVLLWNIIQWAAEQGWRHMSNFGLDVLEGE